MSSSRSFADELMRFERLLAERFPEAFNAMNAGLDDAGIERLQQLVAPYRITADVELLYRWRNGGPEVFGGWRMHDLEALERSRAFGIEMLRYAPARI